jgi:carboxyl-terminal processing protease
MSNRCVCALALPLLLGAALPALAEEQRQAAACARHAWALTDLVLDQGIDPPARQEMLLAGARALLRQAGTPAPADLARRASRVTTEAEYAALLEALWPAGSGKALPDKALQDAMLNGLLQAVPGRPTLLSPEQFKGLEQAAHNRYEGTGIQVSLNDKEKLVQIVTAFPHAPARRAGMRAGDLIEAVDGVDVHGKSLAEVVGLIRGEAGAPVTIVVRQPGSAEKRTLRMVRDVVPFEHLVGYRRTGEESWQYRVDPELPVGYVRVGALTSSALHELRRLDGRLRADGCRALVLDLRDEGQGDAHQAALLADGLLDGGVLWRVRDARNRVQEYRADPDCLFRGWPVVVLVNGATRGGSELVAAALQDNRRAAVVGERTRGDGAVKTFVDAPDGLGVVRLRTGLEERAAAVRRPSTRAVRADEDEDAPRPWGVEPDQVVVIDPEQRSAVLEWHFAQERSDASGWGKKPPEDPQLAKALDLLRAALKLPGPSEKAR